LGAGAEMPTTGFEAFKGDYGLQSKNPPSGAKAPNCLALIVYGLKPVPFRPTHYQIAVPIEFPGDSRYSGGADEFVRQGF
jgi:hypothetical protein